MQFAIFLREAPCDRRLEHHAPANDRSPILPYSLLQLLPRYACFFESDDVGKHALANHRDHLISTRASVIADGLLRGSRDARRTPERRLPSTTSRARPIASMLLLYAVGRRQGRPVAVQVSFPASLAPRREPRRAKPVATKLRTRGDTRNPDQISITRRFGTNDE
jgi:hypothetical protein